MDDKPKPGDPYTIYDAKGKRHTMNCGNALASPAPPPAGIPEHCVKCGEPHGGACPYSIAPDRVRMHRWIGQHPEKHWTPCRCVKEVSGYEHAYFVPEGSERERAIRAERAACMNAVEDLKIPGDFSLRSDVLDEAAIAIRARREEPNG